MASLTGKMIGKYKLMERLGAGGMAEVYKAYHPKLERYVTVKILHDYLSTGEDFLARFEREAKAVAALRHPHIVQIYDFDVEDDIYYMVMEYIGGGTLQAKMAGLVKTGAYMPVRQVLAIIRQVAEALDYAHQQGILHRDIKPSNILLDLSGNSFLTDFGIARMLSGTQFTATGSLLGTPTYMSPEQGQGLDLDPASDIYSLGIVVYELLTGRVPFASDTPLAIIHKQIHESLPSPKALRPELPAAVDQIINKTLAKDPKERYSSAQDMALALEKAFPPDSIVELDSAGTGAAPALAVLPTLRMEEKPAAQQESAPGIVPPKSARIGNAEPSAILKDSPSPIQPESGRAVKQIRVPDAGARSFNFKRIVSGLRLPGWLKSRWALGITIVGILIIVAAVVVLWLHGSSATNSCSSVDSCVAQAQSLKIQGNLPGYIDLLGSALMRVPDNQHPPFAALWCDKGEAEKALGRTPGAISSFNNCIAWTNNNPDLQMLRDRAASGLAGLK